MLVSVSYNLTDYNHFHYLLWTVIKGNFFSSNLIKHMSKLTLGLGIKLFVQLLEIEVQQLSLHVYAELVLIVVDHLPGLVIEVVNQRLELQAALYFFPECIKHTFRKDKELDAAGNEDVVAAGLEEDYSEKLVCHEVMEEAFVEIHIFSHWE
jgi:hypothetical protein